MATEHTDTNRANWDDRVEPHLEGYRVDRFAAEPDFLSDVVREDLPLMTPFLPGGSVDGVALAHLQCHIGTDTLSWARLGAHVTGIDFSPVAISAAQELAAACALDDRSRFVLSTVDDAPAAVAAALAGEAAAGGASPGGASAGGAAAAADSSGVGRFDVVYTGIGALCWLEDLSAWARTIRSLLAPGGLFFVRDAHPVLNALDDERTDGQLVLGRRYFADGTPLRYDDGVTYAGSDDVMLEHPTTYEWPHSLAEIVGALLGEGLQLLELGEQQTLPWQHLPQMVERDSAFVLPGEPDRLPLTFSIAARG